MKELVPILSELEKAAQEGLRQVAKELMEESNRRAPIDTGALRKAAFVKVDDLTVTAGYKRPKGYPYIVRQHENMDYQHPGGGGPKFLESAAQDASAELGEIVASHIRTTFG